MACTSFHSSRNLSILTLSRISSDISTSDKSVAAAFHEMDMHRDLDLHTISTNTIGNLVSKVSIFHLMISNINTDLFWQNLHDICLVKLDLVDSRRAG